MKTLFKFNCVVCGAQPGERKVEKFDWPTSLEKKEQLFGALQWIFTHIIKVSKGTDGFRRAIKDLQALIPYEKSIVLHEFEGSATKFIQECPLCGTPPRERPYSDHFRAWFAWNIVSGVQVGNLLYELHHLFSKIEGLKHALPLFEVAMSNIDMLRCKCGRPTSSLSDGLCRWCSDRFDSESSEDYEDEEYTLNTYNDAERKYITFLESLKDNDILGAGREEWATILSALIKDIKENDRGYFNTAIKCHRVDKWIEPWRLLLKKEKCWPMEWSEDDGILKKLPSAPEEPEKTWQVYDGLPLEAFESLVNKRVRNLPLQIEEILYSRGFLVRGAPDDIDGYLSRSSMKSIREVSNNLGTGKGRSMKEVIGKIFNNATPQQIIAAIPEISDPWIREFRDPTDDFPENWWLYTISASILIRNFLKDKFRSWQTINNHVGKHIKYNVEVNSECPSYCTKQMNQISLCAETSVDQIPPWFPGCGCGVGFTGVSNEDELGIKTIAVGNDIKLEEDDEFEGIIYATVQPFELHGQLERSSSGNYCLLYADGYERENGWYLLIEENKIAVVGRMGRPDDGKVADNGTFFIVDSASRRGNTLFIIDNKGEVITQRTITANISSICISDDGDFAAYSLSDTTVIIFDLKNAKKYSEFKTDLDSANIKIDSSKRILTVTDRSSHIIKYSFNGELIDREE